MRVNIPEPYQELAARYRESLIERVSETDDALITKYVEGGEITVEELKAALRNATITNKLVPVMCGAALKNKGIQLMLDAVLDYLPSPLDVPPVEVTSAKTGEKSLRETSTKAPFAALAFKVVTDPYVGRLVYCRILLRNSEERFHGVQLQPVRAGADRAYIEDARQPPGGGRRGHSRRHHRRHPASRTPIPATRFVTFTPRFSSSPSPSPTQ